MSPPPAASPPFSHAASLAHYETKNSFELMVMAKLRCVSDAGENQEIIARLMAQDRENGTWPGKCEGPGPAAATKTDGVAEKEDGEEVVVMPAARVLRKEERTDGTGVGGEGRAYHVPVAIVSGDRRARAAIASAATTGIRSRSPIIPLSQLAKEWDEDWGAPFAFPLAATTGSKPQAKPATPTESVSSGSKSPVTPASPRSQTSRVSLATPASSPPTIPASLKSNPYNLLMSDEQDDEEKEDDEEEEEEESENEGLIIPLKMYTEKARAAAESTRAEVTYAATFSKDTAAAPTEQTENLPAPDSLASSEPSEVMSAPGVGVLPEAPVVVRDFGAMVSNSPSSSRSLEEAAHKSDVAAFYNMPPLSPVQPATSTKNTPVQVFVSAPPSPPSSPPQQTHTVPPSPAPTKKTHQPRNENRKQDQAVVSSNMWDVLAADDTGDGDDTASTPVAVDTDDNNEVDSEDEAPQARQAQKKKNRRRGKKGGKKVQAMKQKVEQAVEVPVVVAPVLQQSVSMTAKVGKKMEMSQALGVAAIVMVLVALLGVRVVG